MTDRELLDQHGHVLTPRQHEVFELRRVRGMSDRAVAAYLSLDRGTVRGHLESAQRKLHHALRQSEAA